MIPRLSLGYVYSNPLLLREVSSTGKRMKTEVRGLRTDEEMEVIRTNLRESGRLIRFVTDVANTCSLRKLLNSGCQVLHYAGHGNENFLAFESSEDSKCGLVEPLEVGCLKTMLKAGGVHKDTKLVIISSCSSERSGDAFVEAGVPHVVAVRNKQSVSDRAARQFSDLFYNALIKHSGRFTVTGAFESALENVNANGPLEARDPFVLLPEDGNHDVRIFDTLVEGQFVDNTKVLPPRPRCKRAVSSYKGRVGLQKVVMLALDPQVPCVTITGERGSGKTEMAVQACDYVRERHHFDSFLWGDVKKAVAKAETGQRGLSSHFSFASPGLSGALGGLSVSDGSTSDPCRLIGLAVGMPQPGPTSEEELLDFLFKNPKEEGGQPCQKVLLVLDNADSLFETGGDARDRLVELLSYLCSTGGHLKLLVTSEHELLRDTNKRFSGDGSEVVVKIEPLNDADAATFLNEKLPRPFKKTWLRLEQRAPCTTEDITNAIQNHPILKEVLREAKGHPGTLLRLAPELQDHLGDPCRLREMAARYREEFRATRPSPHASVVSCTL